LLLTSTDHSVNGAILIEQRLNTLDGKDTDDRELNDMHDLLDKEETRGLVAEQ